MMYVFPAMFDGLLRLDLDVDRSEWVWAPSARTHMTPSQTDAAEAILELSRAGVSAKDILKKLAEQHPQWDMSMGRIKRTLAAATSKDAAYVIRAVDGKGLGMFAARDLVAGDRIIAEAPLAQWAQGQYETRSTSYAELVRTLDGLDAKRAAQFRALGQAHLHGHERTLVGTWLTNALPINYDAALPGSGGGGSSNAAAAATAEDDDHTREEGAVFALISRINHACTPNCHHEWNPSLRMETIHAVTPIPAGTELTICYLSPAGRTREARHAILQPKFGFRCTCATCGLTGDALAASDARMRAVGPIDSVAVDSTATSAADVVGGIERRLTAMAEAGLPIAWGRPLRFHALMHSMGDSSEGHRARTEALVRSTAECVRLTAGTDHPGYELVATCLGMVRDQQESRR